MVYPRHRSRLNSVRWPGWDYSGPGTYFVTICTRNFQRVLGDVTDGVVRLSPSGRIVAEEWQRTGEIRGNVELDAWVVMPDHLHGIIRVLHSSPSLPGGLGNIIGHFKGMCTRRIRASGNVKFAWHRGFHDRVIRDRLELDQVRAYIARNPHQWNNPLAPRPPRP